MKFFRKQFLIQPLQVSNLVVSFFGIVATLTSSCGYNWQNRGNRWKMQGVEKVYFKTLTNDTLRPGVEGIFLSALIKEFSRGKRLQVVSNEKAADAIIDGTVEQVGSAINSSSTVAALSADPQAKALGDYVIATEYAASATIAIRLTRSLDRKVLWTQSFTRSKIYPANNRFGLQGTTSALINASQEQLSLTEIAEFLASDAYDTMLETF